MSQSISLSLDEAVSSVTKAFECAFKCRDTLGKDPNRLSSNRSSYFVSELAKNLSTLALFSNRGVKPRMQETDPDGKRTSGEWMVDIAIVEEKEDGTAFKNRKALIVKKVVVAVESEFSTRLKHFFDDFSKLLHLKSENYVYIAGLNQETDGSREEYIKAQVEVAQRLVREAGICRSFFIVFVPTPGKYKKSATSSWDLVKLEDLKTWIRGYDLCR